MRQHVEWFESDFDDCGKTFDSSNRVQRERTADVAHSGWEKRVAGTFGCLSYRAKWLSSPSRACAGF